MVTLNTLQVTSKPKLPYSHLGLFVGLWSLCVCVGWLSMMSYQFTVNASPGDIRLQRWPWDSGIPNSSDKPMMIVFVHPKCPCTQATVIELHRIYERIRTKGIDPPNLMIVVNCDTATDRTWMDTSTVHGLMELPGACMFIDEKGLEAQRFGANTSGTVMLFSNMGTSLYCGGVTASRGNTGNNMGAESILELLTNNQSHIQVAMPPFGCKLILSGNQPCETIPHAPSTYPDQ